MIDKIEELGWVKFFENAHRIWFSLEGDWKFPLMPDTAFYKAELIFDPEYNACSIHCSYSGDEEKLYEGHCRSKEELQTIMQLIGL